MPSEQGNGGPHDAISGPCSCGSWHDELSFVVNGHPQPLNIWASASLGEISIHALKSAKYEPDLSRWEARDREGNVWPWSMPIRELTDTVFLALRAGIGA